MDKKTQFFCINSTRNPLRKLVTISIIVTLIGSYAFGQGTVTTQEYNIVDIITSTLLDGTVQKNIFIDFGAGDSAKVDDLLSVYRLQKTPAGNPFRVHIGKVQILETFNEVSKAALVEIEPDSNLSSLKYKTVMVDDICIPVYYCKLIVHFQKSSFTLNPDDSLAIESLSTLPRLYKNIDILIEGHTDNEGNPQYNEKLSLDRANTIKNILVTLGVPTLSMKTIGHGDRYPMEPNTTERGRMENRRVELTISAEY